MTTRRRLIQADRAQIQPEYDLIEPTPANLRAEIARYRVDRTELGRRARINQTNLCSYLTGGRSMTPAIQHNIAWTVNQLIGRKVFLCDERVPGLKPVRVGRPPASLLEFLPNLPKNDPRNLEQLRSRQPKRF